MNYFELFSINLESDYISNLELDDVTVNKTELLDTSNSNEFEKIINYLFFRNFVEFNSDTTFMSEDEKGITETFIEILRRTSDLKTGEIVKFINKFYKEVIEYSNVCKYEVLKYCWINGISNEVQEYISCNCYRELLVNKTYEKFNNVFLNNLDFTDKFLKSLLKDNVYIWNADQIIIILLQLNNSKEMNIVNIIKEFNKSVVITFNETVSQPLSGTESDQVFYQYYNFYDKWMLYLKKIKSEQVYSLRKSKITIDEKHDLVLTKYGTYFSEEIDISVFMEKLRINIEKSDNIALYEFTHQIRAEGKPSIFQLLSNLEESPFEVIFKNNKNYNSFFNRTRQQSLFKTVFTLTHIVHYLITKKMDEFAKTLEEYVMHIDNNSMIDDSYSITFETKILIQMIENINQRIVHPTNEYSNFTSIYYGPTMFICGLIEKILSSYYLNRRINIDYTESKNITLNRLLDTNKKEIVDLLGIEQLRVIRYYLIYDEDDCGMNIRNRLAHLDGLKNQKQFLTLFNTSLMLLCSVISSNFLYLKRDDLDKDSQLY